MSINVHCEACGKHHSVPDSLAGKKARCGCGAVLSVPAAPSPGAPLVDPLQASGGDPLAGPVDPLQANGGDPLAGPVDPLGFAGSQPPSGVYGTPITSEPPPKKRPGWIVPAGIGAAGLVVVVVILLLVLPGGSGDVSAPTDSGPPPVGGDEVTLGTPGGEAGGEEEGSVAGGGKPKGMSPAGPDSEQASGSENPGEVLNSIGMRLARVGGQQNGARKLGSVLPTKEISFDKNNDPELTITADESPEHTILLEKFLIGVHEVTQAEYMKVMGDNPSTTRGDDMPVHGVTWFQAMEFCKRLNEMPAEKEEERVYRLPTEAEWEYVCRGGESSRYYFGDSSDDLSAHAWYQENSDSTIHPVGQKNRNASGTYDMLGNVWEWCHDWYAENYYGTAAGGNEVHGPVSGVVRVIRGGSSWNQAKHTRDAFRFFSEPQEVNERIGFRVACHVKGRPVPVPEPPAPSAGFDDLNEFAEAFYKRGFPDAAIADRRDLTGLPVAMFDGPVDRPEIIKSAGLFYDAIPSNIGHTVGRPGTGGAGEFQGAFAVERESPGGLRYVDGMAIRLLQDDGSSHVLVCGAFTQFGNGWKLTGRFDYVNRMPHDDSMFPLDELKSESVRLPGEDINYGLGHQRGAPVTTLRLVGVKTTAVPFQICLSPDYRFAASVFAHEELTAGLRRFTGKAEIAIWKLEDRSVVFQREWTSEAVGGRIPLVAFTSDSSKVYYGKSRIVGVDLETFQQDAEVIQAPAVDNEWLLHPETKEPVFVPANWVSGNKARFHRDGNIYVLSGNAVSVFAADGTEKGSHDMTDAFRGTYGITSNGDILGYVNRKGQFEDPRKGNVRDSYGNVVLSSGWQSTGPRDAKVKKIAVGNNWMPTTLSPSGSSIYYNERIFTRDILKVWHVQRRRPLFTLQYQLRNLDTSQLKPPFFSHNGRFLMQVIDRAIVIWKIDDPFSGVAGSNDAEAGD